jgi:chitodextrinase
MDKKLIILVCLVLISSLTVTSALAQNPEPQGPKDEDLADHMPGEVLIRFNPWVNSTQAASQMEQLSLQLKREIPALGVKLVKLPPGLSVEEAIDKIGRRSGVEFVEPNYILQIAAINQEEITDQWGLQKIQATQAWSTFSEGQKVPITLAAVDSGIDPTHNDLSTNIWSNSAEIPDNGIDDDINGYIDDTWGWDFVNNDNDPFDDNLHGTAVSSVMVGDLDGDGVAGVCPWCRVMAVKVMTAGGTGTMDAVASGIIYAANSGAKVINLSLAGITGTQTLQDAVDLAWTEGALVVAGAGNDGSNAFMYPAGYVNAMAIGSTGENDTHSCFSNYADGYISVVAPGENILIAIPDQGYAYGSGTSLSTPYVAGLGALLFSQNTGRSNSEVRSIIESTAVDLSPPGVDAAFGNGRIDAYRAVTGDNSPVQVSDGLFSTNNSATGYAHARKIVRDSNGSLHIIWHTKEGTDYRIRYATSNDGGQTWNPEESDVFSNTLETYHPAIATDGQNLFVAIPSRSGVDQPYQILFARRALPDGEWILHPDSLMGETYDAVRPDLYFDPSNGKLHLVASSLDNAPYVYYRSSDNGGLSWNNPVVEINPSTGTTGANSSTRYATIHANGDNIYIVARTVNSSLFTVYYMHSVRSTDGGQTWIDQFKISSYTAIFTGEYGISIAGVGDQVYMGYEVGSNMYFRIHDGLSWSDYETLELGDSSNVYKWPTITQADDGQAWLIFELNGELFMRHYDGSTWAPKESIGTGNYANLKLGTNGDQLEWLTTQCNGAPFLVSYDARSLGGNTPPQADPQQVSTDEDTPLAITLTGSDPDNDPITFNITSQPVNGTLSGTPPDVVFTPNGNYYGTDSFNFTANDGSVNSSPATVSITINPINDPPIANDESATTPEDIPVAITLTGSDVDGDLLSFSVVNNPTSGTLNGAPPNLTYTPNPGFDGLDNFTFMANDGFVDSNIATFSIEVTPGNNPPVADDQSVVTDEDIPVGIDLTANDPDADMITYSLVTGPTNGTLSGTAPNLTYTPDLDISGADSFTFLANDGLVDSNIATVSITINPVNDQPAAYSQAVATAEDTPKNIVLTASDVDGNPLTYILVDNPTNGALSGSIPDLTYTPNPDYNGTDNFTFKVNDGTLESNIATISVTIDSVNDQPVAEEQSVSRAEDTTVGITLTGNDVDNDPVSYIVLTSPSNGALTGIAPNLTYTPEPDFYGTDSFTFKVNDGALDSNIATISIIINPVNDPPIANNQLVGTNEDNPVAIKLTASDVDDASLSFSVISGPTNGTLSGTIPNLTYTPGGNYDGPDSFTFKANDGLADSNTATVSITVSAVNDAPVADDQAVTTSEDTAIGIILTGSDVDSGSLTFNVVNGPTNGLLSGTEPNLTYTPNANYNGPDSFTFTANDGEFDSNVSTVSLTINPVNDPPTADTQVVTTDEDNPVAITLTASDVDDALLTFIVISGPTNGTLSGTIPNLTYTPGGNYDGPDSFTFKANDGLADSNTATVSITVSAVNDAPVADDQAVTTSEDTAIGIILTGSDVDSVSLTYSVVVGPAHGTLSGTAPNLTYSPDENYNGPDSFTFKVNDGLADSNTATVSITVTAAATVVNALASSEIFVAGSVSGEYMDTHNDDDISEAIMERDSGGKPVNRYSYLEHKWIFNVTPGDIITFYANAWNSSSSDGDSFDFAYSTDDLSYTDMITINNTSPSHVDSYLMPASTQGTIYVRVTDSNREQGQRVKDTIFIDQIYIQTVTQSGGSPIPPTASFTYQCTALSCDFDASSSIDVDGTITSYDWTFGDGASASGVTTNHTYAAAGSYSVVLTVTDDDFLTSNDTQEIILSSPGSQELHVGDINDKSTTGKRDRWNAIAEVTIHTASESLFEGASVTGTWSNGRTMSCTTGANGICSLTLSNLKSLVSNINFTITNISSPGWVYNPNNNHDPDGDSNGTVIMIQKP